MDLKITNGKGQRCKARNCEKDQLYIRENYSKNVYKYCGVYGDRCVFICYSSQAKNPFIVTDSVEDEDEQWHAFTGKCDVKGFTLSPG